METTNDLRKEFEHFEQKFGSSAKLLSYLRGYPEFRAISASTLWRWKQGKFQSSRGRERALTVLKQWETQEKLPLTPSQFQDMCKFVQRMTNIEADTTKVHESLRQLREDMNWFLTTIATTPAEKAQISIPSEGDEQTETTPIEELAY